MTPATGRAKIEERTNELRSRVRTLIHEFEEVPSVAIAEAAREVLDELSSSRGATRATVSAILKGHAAREELKEEEGGHVSADEARVFLKLSKPALLDRYKRGRLLGWREKNAIRFPVWQFAETGGLLHGVEEVLQALSGKPSYDDWAKLLFFLNARHSLGGKRPLDLLRQGRTKEVLDLAGADD